MTRAIAIAGAVLAALLLAASIALWAFFQSWLPVQGKARLIDALEHQFPVDVSITSLHYDFFKGFVFQDVEVRDGLRETVQARLPYGQVQMAWPALIGKQLAFRGRAEMEQPAATTISLSGRYHLKARTIDLDVATTDIPIASLGPELRKLLRMPDALSGGEFRARLHLRPSAQALPVIVCRLDGTQLVWQDDRIRLESDLRIDGTAMPPEQTGGWWTVKADVTAGRGTLQVPLSGGPPLIVSDIAGRGRLDQDTLKVMELTGALAGASWRLEGEAAFGHSPAFEGLATASVKLGAVRQTFPALLPGWDADGQTDVRAVCRGRGFEPSRADCQVEAKLRNVTLSGDRLPSPLTDIAGTIRGDLLPKRIVLDDVRARAGRERLHVSGNLRLTDPPAGTLELAGVVPLAMVQPWLPADSPVRKLDGVADAQVTIGGTWPELEYDGTVELRDAAAVLAKPALRIERANGPIYFASDRIETPQMSAVLNGEPLTASVRLTELAAPRVTGLLLFQRGKLQVEGRLTPQHFMVDQASLVIGGSELRAAGAINRVGQMSRLTLTGMAEFEELAGLPFAPLPWIEAWQVRGMTEVEMEFAGSLAHLADAAVRGSLRAPTLSVRQVPFDHVTAEFEYRDRRLRVNVPEGMIAGGKLLGQVAADLRDQAAPEISFETDITALQLEQLAAAVPAWRTTDVSGWASAHARLAGRVGAPASWNGEGWLDAQGQRLGKVPLLDRLFQGLFGVLGDRLGLDALRRAQITQASLQWRLANGRIETDSLRLAGNAGQEAVAIYGKGSVGLDQTLDLVIEPELSKGLVIQAPTTATLASTILKAAGKLEHLRRLIGRHRITGTLKQPQYRFEFSTQEVFRQLVPGPADLIQGFLDAVRR